MKKFSAVLLSILLIFSTSLSAMAAQSLLISSVTKDANSGNWVVKGTWPGNKPLTIEVLKQAKVADSGGERNITWEDVSSAGDLDILNYLAYFNQADNKDGNFEFKIAGLAAEPEVRVYTNGEFFYHSRVTLDDINAASDGTFYDSIMSYAFLEGIITEITDPLNNDEKTEFWNKLYTYKGSKAGGFANFGEIVTASSEIAILSRVALATSDGKLAQNLALLKAYGIDKSNSYDLYMKQGNFAKENYLTDAHKASLLTALTSKAAELNYASDFVQHFNEKVVLTACHNNASDYLIRDIIEKSDMLAKAGIGKFSTLTAAQKLEIAKIVNDSQAEFASVAQLAQKVSTEADKLANAPSDSKDNGRGGSSGGNSGFSVATTPSEVTLPQDSKEKFTDLSAHEWAEAAIYALQEKGIVNGTSATTFEPERSVTREEFVKMLVLAAGILDSTATAPFDDAVSGAWYVPYIASAYNAKLVNGVTDSTFGIGTCITREQLAVMVHRAIAAKGALENVNADSTFTDFAMVSAFAGDAVNYVNAAGIMNGMGDGSFAPLNPVTRAQAAKVIYELIQRL